MFRGAKKAAFQILSRISMGNLGKRVDSVRGSEMGAVVVVAKSTMVVCALDEKQKKKPKLVVSFGTALLRWSKAFLVRLKMREMKLQNSQNHAKTRIPGIILNLLTSLGQL
jgi:hypothetical protein